MTSALVNRMWSWVGLLTFSSAVLAVLRTFGLQVTNPLPGVADQRPYGITVLVILPVTALILFVHWLLRENASANRAGGTKFAQRVPLAFAKPEEVNLESPGGRRYVILFFALFAIIPTVCIVILFFKFWGGTATLDGVCFCQGWGHFWPGKPVQWDLVWKGRYQLDGPTYWPYITPYANLACLFASLVSTVSVVRAVRAK
jgi:hypothetical protein